MSGRDPRVDPRAGDVLRKGRRQRMVKRLGLGPIRPSCLTAPRPLTGVGLRIATLERELATVVRQAVEASGYRYADGEGPEIVAWHRVLDHLEAMRPKAEAAERRAELLRTCRGGGMGHSMAAMELAESDRAILAACQEKGGEE